MSRHPRVGIGVFVWRDGKFLMGRRLGSHGAATWCLPGGHLDFGESWEDCAKREVLEETGLVVNNLRFLTATNDIFSEDDRHYATIWMESDWQSGEPAILEPEKMTDWQWFTFQELPAPLFEPAWRNLRAARPDLFTGQQR